MKAERRTWRARLARACGGDASRLLFLDETGAVTNMARTHGRCARGERCVAREPAGHWRTITAVAAVRLAGLTAPATVAHAMDGELFQGYVDHALLPALRPGDVVVLDNLSCHRLPGVRAAVRAAGARLMPLPPYSPDLNPIEMVWSKVKRLVRSAAARTVDALHVAFADAMAAVTPDDIRGCFRHCGYAATTSGAPL